eukprot:762563-Hanusia_phi.AAC.1
MLIFLRATATKTACNVKALESRERQTHPSSREGCKGDDYQGISSRPRLPWPARAQDARRISSPNYPTLSAAGASSHCLSPESVPMLHSHD